MLALAGEVCGCMMECSAQQPGRDVNKLIFWQIKKIKPTIKTSRKVLNGPYVHNKLPYVFFSCVALGHSSSLQWQVSGHANVTVTAPVLWPSWYFLQSSTMLFYTTASAKWMHIYCFPSLSTRSSFQTGSKWIDRRRPTSTDEYLVQLSKERILWGLTRDQNHHS